MEIINTSFWFGFAIGGIVGIASCFAWAWKAMGEGDPS